MIIVADENIPFLQECFGQVAEVRAVNGRQLNHEDLRQADALIVRSVTPVTRALLDGTPVRFVGTCTIGIDHIDTDYLDEKGIAFASAPGSNADSAAQYVVSALLAMRQRHQFKLEDQVLGIVGCGNVGSRVQRLATALGMHTLAVDPPLKERGKPNLAEWEQLQEADIITLHVPLTRHGKHPTHHMVNEAFLNHIKPSAMLINTARGDIIDVPSLKRDIAQQGRKVVLDVWPNEPRIDEELLSMVQIATPHIAGYSHDGKLKGTEMVYQAFCQAMNIPCPEVDMATDSINTIQIKASASQMEVIEQAVFHSYAILEDDQKLRELLDEPPEQQGMFFDHLRKHYPVRREFKAYSYSGEHAPILAELGFQTQQN